MGDGYPDVPVEELTASGWERCVRSEETVFRTPAAAVIGRTVLYDDAALRSALSEVDAADAVDLGGTETESQLVDTGDRTDLWRFFFATALSFRPPLAPGIGPASMRPTVVSEARQSFADDLRARGFAAVEQGRRQRLRTETGDRARLRKLTATLPASDTDRLPTGLDVEGWLAVWTRGGSFRIAGGVYPVSGLNDLLAETPSADRPPTDPGTFRDELIDLVRAVA